MPRRNHAWKDFHAAGFNRVIVISLDKWQAAQLRYLEPPPALAIVAGQSLQRDHAVYDAVQLPLRTLRRSIVQQQHRASPSLEIPLQRQSLPAVALRLARQQA